LREDVHRSLGWVGKIRPEERDGELKLQTEDWGKNLPDYWTQLDDPRHFMRTVKVHGAGKDATKLREFIVPFPEAPIYGINRKAEYGMSIERQNIQSLRVLLPPDEETSIDRVILLHNGLNESTQLGFYYRLADWIVQEAEARGEGAACVIMPFPGHLMHFSFQGPFGETPLSRYLTDAGELFRQFLRYMVGVRWLLSIVADSDAEDWMVGGKLLGPDAKAIKGEILTEANDLHVSSERRFERAPDPKFGERDPSQLQTGLAIEAGQVSDCVEVLRRVLGREDLEKNPETVPVHVVGYSLGGYLAQSVFFAWPQVVSSCTTICSGGAISALSPTAFADPEEWQAVLHALRPELSNSMLQGRLADETKAIEDPVEYVSGMKLEQFGYFQRIFDQVFLQEDRGSYKERLSEYGPRMLFVSGGEDPIVRPTNILDASPEEGITMLSVSSMTHFLNQAPKAGREQEKTQRDYWLPEAGRLIGRAAIRAEEIHTDERGEAARLKAEPKPLRVGVNFDEDLRSSEMFESALDWVLDAVDTKDGWLLVCRNGLPPAFIKEEHHTLWAKALHHHDLRIQQYAAGLRRRAAELTPERTTVIVPKLLSHWFVNLTARFDPHSDAPSGRFTTMKLRQEIWEGFEADWGECIRWFDAGPLSESCVPVEADDAKNLADWTAAWLETEPRFLRVTHLPDVWIGIKPGKLFGAKRDARQHMHHQILNGVSQALEEEAERREKEKARREAIRNDETPPDLTKTALEEDLDAKNIRVVQVSGAESNPRFRGRVEESPSAVLRLLARSAAGLLRSAHTLEEGD
jgi:pimeloyl-ACP methyl ester carboxylesterase